MPFDKKIKQLKFIEKNLGKFIGKSALRHSNELEDAITENQLFEKGEDGLGNPLGEYADSTKFFKEIIAGQLGRSTRSDHITLKDTGEFYESVRIKLTSKGIEIVAETKKDNNDLIDKFGKEILFINDENLDDFIRPNLLDDLRKDIRKALR